MISQISASFALSLVLPVAASAQAGGLGYTEDAEGLGYGVLRQGPPRVLFFTLSSGFVHDVVKRPESGGLAPAEKIFEEAARGRFDVKCSQDVADLAAEKLESYAAILFMTTGELPLPPADRDALIAWVAGGGAFAGVHCATDTLYEYAPYVEMIGGTFDGHPWHEPIAAQIEDPLHPATAGLRELDFTDEIYQFKNYRRHPLRVLLTLNTKTVDVKLGKREDGDYALAWTRDWGEGRVFYTALGHREEVWRDPRFQRHLLDGIAWAIDGPDVPARYPDGATPLFARVRASREYSPPPQPPTLSSWSQRDGKDAAWRVDGDAMEVVAGAGDIRTRESFGDGLYHVEFMTPSMPDATGQARGNSGVYLQGNYEVQVLDSYGLELGMGDCGSIYGKRIATVNACRKPERWQAYDIEFRAPRFDAAGKKTENARITVWLNGRKLHDDFELDGPTGGGGEEAPLGPLLLQDHGNPVRYRNVWYLPR